MWSQEGGTSLERKLFIEEADLSLVWLFLKESLWNTFLKYDSFRVAPLGPVCLWKEEEFETVVCDHNFIRNDEKNRN